MNRQQAFAHHGVTKIGRSQWHAQADDGTHVLSVWEDKISADSAQAHIHNHAQNTFAAGTRVWVVVQRGIEDPDTKNVVTQNAEPDRRPWVVVGQEMRAIDHPRRRFLHVLKIKLAKGGHSQPAL